MTISAGLAADSYLTAELLAEAAVRNRIAIDGHAEAVDVSAQRAIIREVGRPPVVALLAQLDRDELLGLLRMDERDALAGLEAKRIEPQRRELWKAAEKLEAAGIDLTSEQINQLDAMGHAARQFQQEAEPGIAWRDARAKIRRDRFEGPARPVKGSGIAAPVATDKGLAKFQTAVRQRFMPHVLALTYRHLLPVVVERLRRDFVATHPKADPTQLRISARQHAKRRAPGKCRDLTAAVVRAFYPVWGARVEAEDVRNALSRAGGVPRGSSPARAFG